MEKFINPKSLVLVLIVGLITAAVFATEPGDQTDPFPCNNKNGIGQ